MLEIGRTRHSRVSENSSGIVLDRDTVFVVTGAAGSIVSAITADLAAASGGTFHLLDLAPKPDPQDAELQRFGDDRAEAQEHGWVFSYDGAKRDARKTDRPLMVVIRCVP